MARRDLLLVVIAILLGPPVASVVFALIGSVIEGVVYETPSSLGLLQHLPILIFFSYVYGLVPGLIGAFIMAPLSRRLLARGMRLLVGALVGAGVTLPVIALLSLSWQTFVVGLAVVPGGALAGLLSIAIVDWLAPMPPAADMAP